MILLVIVLGAAAWLLAKRSTSSWESSTGHLPETVVRFPINDVAQITIEQPTGQVNLNKKGDSWVVAEKSDYPADFEMVSTFVREAWELKPVQELRVVGSSQLGKLSLLPPRKGTGGGTLAIFRSVQGKRLAAILFGKKYMRETTQSFAQGRPFPAGRYVTPETGLQRVFLVSAVLPQIDERPEQWLDRSFIKIQKPVSVTVAGSSPGLNWTLERTAGAKNWKLVGATSSEQLDQAKTIQIVSALSSISSFVDVIAPNTKPESIGLDRPTIITIKTEDGSTYILKIGNKMGETYPLIFRMEANPTKIGALVKGEKSATGVKFERETKAKSNILRQKLAQEQSFKGRIFLVPQFGIERLKKNRADLLLTKTTPATSSSPSAGPPLQPHKS
ncbi:MAG TPA: DUF4340 domain-containing protein [Chthoniobacterales bacterium]